MKEVEKNSRRVLRQIYIKLVDELVDHILLSDGGL